MPSLSNSAATPRRMPSSPDMFHAAEKFQGPQIRPEMGEQTPLVMPPAMTARVTPAF